MLHNVIVSAVNRGSPRMMMSAKHGVNFPSAFLKSSVTSLQQNANVSNARA